MATILAFDTATAQCSVSLKVKGSESILTQAKSTPQQHTDYLLPMVQQLLAEADIALPQLDAIAFGKGPGSFTGLRIALCTAQGLALGAGIPLIPISSLLTLASKTRQLMLCDKVLPTISANSKQIYSSLCCYDDKKNDWTILLPEQIDTWESISLRLAALPMQTCLVGAGLGHFKTVHLDWTVPPMLPIAMLDALPHAAAMIPLALAAWHRGVHQLPEQASVNYLQILHY